MPPADLDPERCPLCNASNACGIAAGESSCWCFAETIATSLLDRIPPASKDVACICQACATGRTDRGSV